MSEQPTISPLRNQPDERLARLATGGSVAAFEVIVDRYRGPLTRACADRVPATMVDDAVQQTFVNAWTALHRGAEVRDLRAWLYQISRNCGYRLTSRERSTDTVARDVPTTEGAHEILERKLRLRAMLDAVASLPDRQRAALVSTAIDGQSGHDAAALLGVNESTLRQLVRRARVAVRAAAAAVGLPVPLGRLLAARAPALAARLSFAPATSGAAGVITKTAAAVAVLATATTTVAMPIVPHFSAGSDMRATAASDRAVGAPTDQRVPGGPLRSQPSQSVWRVRRPNASRRWSLERGAIQSTADETPSGLGGADPSSDVTNDGSGGDPSVVEPPPSEPPASEPSATEPAATEPAASEPAATESPASEPAANESPSGEQSAGEASAIAPASTAG